MEDIEASDEMQTPAERKRVKRLLRLLKSQQYHDTILTPATVMSFKYLLPYNKLVTRCRVMFTISEDTGRKEEAFVRYTRPRGRHLIVPFALDIFLSCIVYDFKGEKAWPTVITWPCPIRHRTLYFFAYLNFNMRSGQYTIPELLALRKKGEKSRAALEKDFSPSNEIASLFRQQGIGDWRAAMKDLMPDWTPPKPSCKDGADDKTPMPPRSDSSSSSEEVLFKGTARRRQNTSRETVVSRQVEPRGPLSWKYSGRTESDPSATEPLSAPTGLPAQKSEGFQRFYKAVVSPTHVRVTAGGRIVPNTRAPPSSPTMNRAQEGSVAGSNNGNDKVPGNAPAVPMPMQAGMGQHMPPVMPPFFPGYGHPGFQPYGPQMPFYPMPYGHPMAAGYPPFPYPMPILRQPSMDSALKDTLNLKTVDGQVDTAEDSNKGHKVETAHPAQFDQRRPFFMNGQWMYPVQGPFPPPAGAMGGPYMPMQMPMQMPMPMPVHMARGPVPPMGPPVPPSAQTSQLGSPIKLNGPAGAGQHARGFPGPSMMPPAGPAGIGFQAPAAPPISSIRPSEITRKQIGIFRKSLKYHEDQLQYNRHQIDEKDTEQKIQKYRDDIARFECMMRVQIEDEKKRGYPPLSEKDKSSEDSSVSDKKMSTSSEEAVTDGISAEQPTAAPVASVLTKTPSNPSDQDTGSRSISQQHMDDAEKKPGLPTGAALAAPFEPRKDAPGASIVTDRTTSVWNTPGIPTYPRQTVDGSYGRFMSGGQPWEAYAPEPSMSTDAAGQAFDMNVTSVAPKGYLGVPYLIGSLPRGMNPRTAKDIDYQYSRELTEDELRARHLYWGRVPRSAVRGLPKYDGRNFYPPSPVKNASKDTSASQNATDLLAFTPTPKPVGSDLMSFTPKPIGTISVAQPARPSTPVGSALVPCDSFELAKQQNGDDGIYTVNESVKAADQPDSIKGKSDAGIDSESVISHDRRSEKPGGARLWEAMLKKGSSAALSSTTAEGKLQTQYAGSAAASLSPTINRISDGPASPGKESSDSSDGGALLTPAPERRAKNRALSGEASREQHLANNGSGSVSTALGA